MPSDQQIYDQKVVPSLAYQFGGSCMYNGSTTWGLAVTLPGATQHSIPPHGFELQPLEVCPKKFIVFDQTDSRSRIMFHPAVAKKFNCPGFDIQQDQHNENEWGKNDEDNGNRGSSSSFKEDIEDIDALLSLEEEEEEKEDGDKISIARTLGSCGNISPDSCSKYGSNLSKRRLSSVQKLCSGSSCNGERKELRMKKMVKVLRGIIPGGDQMSTVTVLDEAVRYLQSLKVEAKRLGVGDLKV